MTDVLTLGAAALATLALACASARAATDPMRPLGAAGAASAPASASPGTTAPAAARDEPRSTPEPGPLVAIRQDGPQQWRALFGERWVRVGDRLEGGRVVSAIDALSVRLQAPGTRQTRTLYLLPPLQYQEPTAEKRPSP